MTMSDSNTIEKSEMNETQKPEPSENPAETETPKNTKQAYRKQVWDYLEKNKLAKFPRPVYGRIPNFSGAEEAANKLLELEEFKQAKSIEVNPDKPLEYSRIMVLKENKKLFVPVPRLQEGLLKKLSIDEKVDIKRNVSRWGMENLGKSVDFDETIHIDLLILGSVAVSKSGYRIGKGQGFADLEFAILKEMNMVDESTVILTTVHDSQVFDTLPPEIFRNFDVHVDYILTPTQLIEIESKLPRPDGLIWNLLTETRVNSMPILKKIKEIHSSEGRDTTLNEVDDVKDPVERKRSSSKFKFARVNNENVISKQRPRRRRYFRKSKPVPDETNTTPEADDSSKLKKRKPSRKPQQIDFSLQVGNIERNVRVRHLKDALIGNGIKPNNITWRGYKGFCYLHYGKPIRKNDKINDKEPFAVDKVIEILQSLKITPESNNLTVKVMEPITRIETTDVTAV